MKNISDWLQQIATVLGAIGTCATVLYAANPSYFMNLLYLLINFAMMCISTSVTIGFLSRISFGNFLAGVIASHDKDPEICAVTCK